MALVFPAPFLRAQGFAREIEGRGNLHPRSLPDNLTNWLINSF
jgi:hypothetical protein